MASSAFRCKRELLPGLVVRGDDLDHWPRHTGRVSRLHERVADGVATGLNSPLMDDAPTGGEALASRLGSARSLR